MKNKKLLRTAAALLLIGVGVVSAGCSFEIEQPDWVTQALCDHVFDEEVLEEVTCTEDGRVMKVCSDCGKTKIVTVKATGHDVVEDEAVDATCTTPGLTAGSHCTACGEVLVKQEEVVGEHTYGAWTVDVAATCTTEGQQKRVCSVCGETETEAISASHIDESGEGVCDVCKEILVDTSTYEQVAVSETDLCVGTWYRLEYTPGTDDSPASSSQLSFSNLNGFYGAYHWSVGPAVVSDGAGALFELKHSEYFACIETDTYFDFCILESFSIEDPFDQETTYPILETSTWTNPDATGFYKLVP